MALLNNVYYNAAFMGCIHGALAGRDIKSATAADYLALTQAAQAFATKLDSLIAFDALVTTGASNTMLVDTASNTIQSDTQMRPGLLQAICAGIWDGRRPTSTVQADYAVEAAAAAAAFTEALLLIVSP